MEIIFKSDIPIYLQIIEQFKISIVKGDLLPGEKLDSVRDLAINIGVNPNTMQRALQELEKEGLFYSDRTSGRFITEKEGLVNQLKEELSNKFMNNLFENLKKIGMNDKEIIEAVRDWKGDEKK